MKLLGLFVKLFERLLLQGAYVLTASGNDAILVASCSQQVGRPAGGDRLAATLKLDMGVWFTRTTANYFGKVSKSATLDAIREAKGAVAPAWDKAKKAELAAIAERETGGAGWLPEILRKAA